MTDNVISEVYMENIKRIDSAGRLVLGKQFAGSFVSIDSSNPNEISIKLVDVIPKGEEAHVTTLTADSFSTLVDYMENPPQETEAFLSAKSRYNEVIKK